MPMRSMIGHHTERYCGVSVVCAAWCEALRLEGHDFILKGSDFLHQTIRTAKPLKAIVTSYFTLIRPKAYTADLSREQSGAIV